MARRRKKKTQFSPVLVIFIVLSLLILLVAYKLYFGIFAPNINPEYVEKTAFVEIPSNSDFDDVIDQFEKDHLLMDLRSFSLVAKKMNYPNHVYAGRYPISEDMNNYDLIAMLRSGVNQTVMLTIDKFHTIYELAAAVGNELEIDSADIINHILESDFLSENHLTAEEAITYFIPNTYEFYWNTSLEKFFERMKKESDKFWTPERTEKARKIYFSKADVYTLASIVQEEAVHEDEMERIAGLYLNRIRKKMRLDADPTIKYIVRNRADNKVYIKDYQISSAYNTYQNAGLPPGPIIMARMKAMDAVLNAERHDYIFMCAKADGSGYHEFTSSHRQHINNRNLYLRSKKK
jgi:UPF0755 protein